MSNKMQRNAEKMPKKARTVLYNLIKDIRKNGPVQPYYSNYSKLGQNTYHCHLMYHWIAVWRYEKNELIVEVEYVGSREKAPY